MESEDKKILRSVLEKKSKNCDPTCRSTCTFTTCSLHEFCVGKTIRKRMIREFCLVDCMYSMRSEVRQCPSPECPFFPFRMGRNTPEPEKSVTAHEIAVIRQKKNAQIEFKEMSQPKPQKMPEHNGGGVTGEVSVEMIGDCYSAEFIGKRGGNE